MRKIVSNTTPILSLLKIGKLHLLEEIYSEIFVPKAVYDEIEQGRNKEFYIDLEELSWVNVVEIQNKDSLSYLLDLDVGEAEAIVLTRELGADLLLMDEKLGRFYAKKSKIKISGTLGILVKAKELEMIHEVKPELDKLISKNVWLRPNLYKTILEQTNEL